MVVWPGVVCGTLVRAEAGVCVCVRVAWREINRACALELESEKHGKEIVRRLCNRVKLVVVVSWPATGVSLGSCRYVVGDDE